MPPYICVPNQGSQFLGSGYLSNACGPFALGADPARPGFAVRDLSSPKGVDDARFADRREWKDLVDDHFARQESDDCADDDGQLLPAGLRPAQLARRHARRSASRARPTRPRRSTA